MKLLENKTNVDAPTTAYPFGELKNDTGTNDGTPVDQELLGDSMQFFEKVFNESGLTANGLPDNETNGFQLYEALRTLFPVRQKIVDIGDWDMDADNVKVVNHGLDFTKIRGVDVIIRSDDDLLRVPLIGTEGTVGLINGTQIQLARLTGGVFDGTGYDSTGYNRGFVLIDYID